MCVCVVSCACVCLRERESTGLREKDGEREPRFWFCETTTPAGEDTSRGRNFEKKNKKCTHIFLQANTPAQGACARRAAKTKTKQQEHPWVEGGDETKRHLSFSSPHRPSISRRRRVTPRSSLGLGLGQRRRRRIPIRHQVGG